MPEVAAFDVDKTLTVRDCVVPFMVRVGGRRSLLRAFLARPTTMVRWIVSGDRDAVKEHVVSRVFAGRTLESVTEEGIRYASHVVSRWMREDSAERLRWHQEQGHVVVLVSASLSPYLEPFADMLEVDAVLCTGLDHDNGILTGRLAGPNCRGPEKAARLRAWLEEAGLADQGVTWAYGDSAGDDEMLALASHGHRVDGAPIRREARSDP